MSFFNFGPSPTKSVDDGFKMFGSSNSSNPPGSGQPGCSIFSSAGFGSPRKEEAEGKNHSPAAGQAGDIPTPAKKMRAATSHPQTTRPAGSPWVAPPTNRPGQPDSQQSSQAHSLPMTSQMAQGQTNPQQAETPQPSVHRQGSYSYNQGPGPATEEKKNISYPDLKEERKMETNLDTKKSGDGEDILADIVFKDLINMQKQQLSELLPRMREGEEKSEQILDSARLVLKDVVNYGEKLAGMKQQYCSRLNQVSSFLMKIPNADN